MDVNTEYLTNWPARPTHPPVDDELYDYRTRAARMWKAHSLAIDEYGPNDELTLVYAKSAEHYDALASTRYAELNAPTLSPAERALTERPSASGEEYRYGRALLAFNADPGDEGKRDAVQVALREYRKAHGYEENLP